MTTSDYNLSFNILGSDFQGKPCIQVMLNRNPRHQHLFSGLTFKLLEPLLERFCVSIEPNRVCDLMVSESLANGYRVFVGDIEFTDDREYLDFKRSGDLVRIVK